MVKLTNAHIVRDPEERQRGAERLFEEIMPPNSPHLTKDMNTNIQEAQQTPSRKHSESHTETHYSQAAESQRQRENLKSSKRDRSDSSHARVSSKRMSADFSSETLEARRQ